MQIAAQAAHQEPSGGIRFRVPRARSLLPFAMDRADGRNARAGHGLPALVDDPAPGGVSYPERKIHCVAVPYDGTVLSVAVRGHVDVVYTPAGPP